jgi:hypothetical protein
VSCCCKPCVYESTGTCVPPWHYCTAVLLCTHLHTVVCSILQQTLVQTTSSNKNITLYFTRIQPVIKVYTSVSNYSSHQWVPRDTHHTSLLIIHPLISSGKNECNGKQKFCTNDGPGIELCELLWFPCHACKPTVFAVVATPTCPLPPPTTTLFVQQITVFLF